MKMHCHPVRERALTILALVATIVSACLAPAQQPQPPIDTDYPTYKGNPARQGHATDVGPGSGSTDLRWFAPNTSIVTQILDNTMTGTARNPVANWLPAPNDIGQALFSYFVNKPDGTGVATPAYEYATCVPTAAFGNGYDPTTPALGSTLSNFDWTFTPGIGSFAPYVWLPTGPTTVGGVTTYPQRYFVYQVLVNGNPLFYDIVDTYASGTGWVRLVPEGANSDMVVTMSATTDTMTIRLLNTMVRDTNGVLTMPNQAIGNPTDAQLAAQYVVYADAAQIVPTSGDMVAQPTVMTVTRGTETIPQVVAARNALFTSFRNGQPATVTTAVISAYRYNGSTNVGNTGNEVQTYWNYPLALTSSNVTSLDNDTAGVVTGTGFTTSTATGVYTGADYLTAILTAGTATGDVRYAPTLADGAYEIWAYLSGNAGGQTFGTATYEIHQGTTVTSVAVDQTQVGWVRVGTQTYTSTSTEPLDVRVTNNTPITTDAGKSVYADAIRFVGESDIAVTSTPVQATVGIRKWVPDANGKPQVGTDGKLITAVEQTQVVVVADERGVLHCLDAIGNADGTTREYWSYPSIQDQNYANWVDPNVRENIDGRYNPSQPPSANTVTAIMPTGFDTTSAVVQRVNGQDLLWIGSRNGRVYCITMEGRGDYNISQSYLDGQGLTMNSLPGTTKRQWTYPADPLDTPTIAAPLGPIVGSVSYADTANGPTVFIPDSNGRIYAVNAAGDATSHTTSVYSGWPYPALTSPTLGQIESTPAYLNGKLYFGTMRLNDGTGSFYALTDAGALAWPAPLTSVNSVDFSDFRCSPAVATAAQVQDASGANYVFALNDNGHLYAFNADTGVLLWDNNELPIASTNSLGFTNIGVAIPGVTVSGSNGRFVVYRANQTMPTGVTSRVMIQRRLISGEELTAPAFAAGQVSQDTSLKGWLYFGARNGTLYAFADASASGSNPAFDNNPIEGIQGPEDTTEQSVYFTKTKFHFITPDLYRQLQGLATGRPDYQTATTTGIVTSSKFDWGQTVYVLLYDFPYIQPGGLSPAIANLEITVDGKVIRTLPAASLQFAENGALNPPRFDEVAPTVGIPPHNQNPKLDGYSVAQFTFQGGGQNALPPGAGRFSLSMTASGTSTNAAPVEVQIPNDTTIDRKGDFYVLNPIGLSVDTSTLGQPNTLYAIGYDPTGVNPTTGTNGSPGTYANLAKGAGLISHGQSGTTTVYVYDRSLMSNIRPPGIGLDNVRVQLNNLRWQGGEAAIVAPLDNAIYPLFEDKPTNFPNTSLDYPDIGAERVRVVKDPNGKAENPVAFKVSLKPVTGYNAATGERTLHPTRFDFSVDVPRYQPPNAKVAALTDSAGTSFNPSYYGRVDVFVDSLENGNLDTVATREAYRSFNLWADVAPSREVVSTIPSVNLGSLASGTGYTPLPPAPGSLFDPWMPVDPNNVASWSGAYQTFGGRNEGNVNLLDVRLAKSMAGFPWPILSGVNDPLAWMNGGLDLWSDIDPPFALNHGGFNNVILPKPRVEDRSGTELLSNPVSRISGGPLVATVPSTMNGYPNPRLAVSVPFGLPSGTYASSLKIFEDLNHNGTLDVVPGSTVPAEPASQDNGLVVSFNVRESRLTTKTTQRTAVMLDQELAPTGVQQFPYTNLQPAAFRAAQGQIVTAWVSNRDSRLITAMPTSPAANRWRIFVESVGNNFRKLSGANAPLWDLNQFLPSQTSPIGRWYSTNSPTHGYPDLDSIRIDRLFEATGRENFDAATARFHSPAFPTTGSTNPYQVSPTQNRIGNKTFMAFVGEATETTSNTNESLIFITPVTVTQTGQVNMMAKPVALTTDRTTAKSRPTVVPSGDGAYVYYAGTTGGTTALYGSYFDGTAFGPVFTLNVGTGFDSAGAPSAFARSYQGANDQYGGAITELVFEAKLHGRANTEAYMGRLPSSTPNRFAFMPMQNAERAVAESSGLYRTRGLVWDTVGAPMGLVMRNTVTGALTTLFNFDPSTNPVTLYPTTTVFDRQSGLITFDSPLGGKVTIDPNQGTIRFSTGTLPSGNELLVTYRPAFFRVSKLATSAGYSSPTVLFDDHFVTPDILNPAANRPIPYWFLPSGRRVLTSTAKLRNHLLNDRYLVFYNRASATAGQAARPLMNSMRFGVRVPFSLTDLNGNLLQPTVTGATGPYQLDPTANRIYFTALDEDRAVTISNANAPQPFTANVGIVQESDEAEIPIEQAVNESALTAFMDPFVTDPFANNDVNQLRPPLIWMFWISTRAGNPDVYFQTIAPHIAPVVKP